MANATQIVQQASSWFGADEGPMIYLPMESTNQTFYPGEMVGTDSAGYVTSCDDTTNVQFLGLYYGIQLKQDTGVAGQGPQGMGLKVGRPYTFSMKTNWTAAITDIGRPVWAKFNNQVDIVPNTNGNFVGTVRRFISTAEVEIWPSWFLPETIAANSVLTATFAGNADNYNPAGLFAARELRLDHGGAARNITGIAAGYHGKKLRLISVNTGAFAFTLVYNSGSSSAGNKIVATGAANALLNQLGTAELIYDTTALAGAGAWRVLSTN